jgi:hypothetical protein
VYKMRRNKKGSMELSVNSIVILVIAIVIMGLILGFIRSKFAEVGGNLVTNEPDPQPASLDEPITLSRETISTTLGSNAVMKMTVYNINNTNIVGAYGEVNCPSLTIRDLTTPSLWRNITVSSGKKQLDTVTQATFILTINPVKNNLLKGSYLCSVYLRNTSVVKYTDIGQKDFVIQVN